MSEWISCPKCGALMIGITAGHICPLCGYKVPAQTITTTTGTSAEYVPVIRCKDCEDCTETKLYDGQRWNYCMRLRCVVKENDFCCWAERKYPKIKAKVTE
jgi:hypothetical protein